MGPAPLQDFVLKVHLRPIAVDAAGKVDPQRRCQHDRFASRSQDEYGEAGRHERPQPRFDGTTFEGGFINGQVRLFRQSLDKFIVNWFERGRRASFQMTDVAGAARHLADVAAEHRRLAT